MNLWMWMRYVLTRCMCVLVYYGYQGLLDEGDSSMDDEEKQDKVSVSVKLVM